MFIISKIIKTFFVSVSQQNSNSDEILERKEIENSDIMEENQNQDRQNRQLPYIVEPQPTIVPKRQPTRCVKGLTKPPHRLCFFLGSSNSM